MKHILLILLNLPLVLLWIISMVLVFVLCCAAEALAIWGTYEYIAWFFRTPLDIETKVGLFFIGLLIISAALLLFCSFALLKFPFRAMTGQFDRILGHVTDLHLARRSHAQTRTLLDAVEGGLIDILEVVGKGGFHGLSVKLRNLTGRRQYLKLTPSDVFLDKTQVYQRMSVLKETEFEVAARRTVTVEAPVYCLDPNKPAPPPHNNRAENIKKALQDSRIAPTDRLSKMSSDELLACLSKLDQNALANNPGIFAIPQYTLGRLDTQYTDWSIHVKNAVAALEAAIPHACAEVIRAQIQNTQQPHISEALTLVLGAILAEGGGLRSRMVPEGLPFVVKRADLTSCELGIGVVQHALWSFSDKEMDRKLHHWVETVLKSNKNLSISLEDAYDITRAAVATVLVYAAHDAKNP